MVDSRVALNRAFEAVNHLADPTPPWMDILDTAKQLVGADSGTLIVFDSNRRLANLSASGFTDSCSVDYDSYYYRPVP